MIRGFILYIVLLFSSFLTGQVDLAVQKAHSADIILLEFSNTGKYLASLGDNNECVIWDVYHEKSISSFTLSSIETIKGIKFDLEEKHLLIKTTRTTFFYDIANESFDQKQIDDSLYYSKKHFYDEKNNFEIFLKKGSIRKKNKDKHFLRYKIGISDDIKGFSSFDVSIEENMIVGAAHNERIYIYNYQNGTKRKELKGHNSEVKAVRFSKNGTYFATTGKDRSIIIWNTKTLTIHKRLSSNVFRKKTVEFSHDGQHIYVGDELGYVYDIDFSYAFPQITVSRLNYYSVNKIIRNQEKERGYLVATSNNFVYLKNNPLSPIYQEKYPYRAHSFLESKAILLEKTLKTYSTPFGEIEHIDQSPNGKLLIYTGPSEFPCITLANLEENKVERIYKAYNNTLWKDIGFITDSIFLAIEDSTNILHFWEIREKDIYQKTHKLLFLIEDFEVLSPSEIWLNTKHNGQYIYNPYSRKYKKKMNFSANGITKKNNFLIFETGANALVFYDLEKEETYHRFIGHKAKVTDINFHPDGNKFVTSSEDGTIQLWSLKDKQSLATIIPFKNNEFIFITHDNYYMMSKGAMDEIGFKIKENYFYPEQFDLKYNRPDIVLKQMGYSSPNLIAAYRKAYLKRLKKMNFTEKQIRSEFHLPTVEILNKDDITNKTTDNSVSLHLKFKDEKFEIDRINIWINGVAIYGINGINVRDRKTKEIEEKIEIELAMGKNKIEISILNQSGVESYKSVLNVEKMGNATPPNLFIASIGTSKHLDHQYDLEFADKDARDIVKVFKQGTFFNTVNAITLTNEEVKLENLAQLKDFFGQAKIDDVVILFIAGHGILNAEFDYYFATHDIDFDNPELRGVPYEAIEKLLDGISALKKLLFIDTCHSGELDKDDIDENREKDEEELFKGPLIFRNAGKNVRLKDNPLGLKSTNDLMKSLFTDLRKGTGATVISSSGGTELSIEGAEFNNGLFTYCLLKGLSDKEADINKDKIITISELQKYVQIEVNRISNGLQTPTSRIQNNELDYRVW